MLELIHVTKCFGSILAPDDVIFIVPSNQIVGFLGPNEVRESTYLCILTRLVAPDEEGATVGGVCYANLSNPAATVGSLPSAEESHPGRSGLETLRMTTLTLGLPRHRVGEILVEIDLSDAETRRRVGAYSLGMRQRFGVAQALLSDPQALILDEPTNDLDPQGQRWFPDPLRSRAVRGYAVLLSSHQLHEVSRLTHRVVMIGGERLLAGRATGNGIDFEERYFALTFGTDRVA